MKRLFPALCVVLLFVSCAGDPAVPEDTPEQILPESPSVESETGSPDQDDELPEIPAEALSPEDDDVDYYYPEPELTMPESRPDEPETIVEPGKEPSGDIQRAEPEEPGTITESPAPESKPAPAPESAPMIDRQPETARKQEPAGSGIPDKTMKQAPAGSRTVDKTNTQTPKAIKPKEKTQKPEPGDSKAPEIIPEGTSSADEDKPSDAIIPDEPSASEAWDDKIRSPEPPPPVFRAEVEPSRSVTVPRDGYLEVWYPGTGWVYLGDASGLMGVSYDTRKIENLDTLFTFRARRAGNYILEFSRYDVLTDEFIQDALSVTVDDPVPGKQTTVRAPDFVLAGTASGDDQGDKDTETSAVMQDEPVLSAPPTSETEQTAREIVREPGEMLREAQSRLASGDAPAALEMLDQFFETAMDGLDEGWYLRGQSYEANSAARNIRKALEAYETVVTAYPDSARWKEADERIRYIKQFYFKVR